MTNTGIILISFSAFCACWALFFQKRDHVKGYGSTMGGEMTVAAIWSLVAVLAGIGAGMILKWFWGVVTFVVIYVLSYGIRSVFESMMVRTRLGRGTKTPNQWS